MALQSQDLVWVDGKSTHWLHPFEIEELRNHPKISLSKGVHAVKPSPSRIVCRVQLPDHLYSADSDPWPPTIYYHIHQSGFEAFQAESQTESFIPHFTGLKQPVRIGTEGDAGCALVTVKWIRESGYSGRGRRSKPSQSIRLTPVFERSKGPKPFPLNKREEASRRISIEFLID